MRVSGRSAEIFGVMVMGWPGRIVLGVLGRRPDELSLIWAGGLAGRWDAELHVVAGHHPPAGMFPHIVTGREIRAARRRAREELTALIREVDCGPPVGARLTLVTHNQLDDAIAGQARRAGLVLFAITPVGIFAARHRSRARQIAARVTCPASLGPGQAIEPPSGIDLAH